MIQLFCLEDHDIKNAWFSLFSCYENPRKTRDASFLLFKLNCSFYAAVTRYRDALFRFKTNQTVISFRKANSLLQCNAFMETVQRARHGEICISNKIEKIEKTKATVMGNTMSNNESIASKAPGFKAAASRDFRRDPH